MSLILSSLAGLGGTNCTSLRNEAANPYHSWCGWQYRRGTAIKHQMSIINELDEELSVIRGLPGLAGLLDDAGTEYFLHSILLLNLIQEAVVKASALADRLVDRLRTLS
jgi:hypothetical protein